ncbi:unnamed protein product [Musa acuminata subsp. malaccensis]|uniref:(wild Malaysian banana) hypothetical protein n=1 Tax=Musa acuminata subsp. malaccensis TaxID=214687 RepID=A0A804KRY8_MUSAM|nr:unnamed protein product [Musa acuminata subsp. malaccensis]
MAFLVLRQFMSTVQCILTVAKEAVSPQMVKFATGLSNESIVDLQGIVSIPKDPIKGTGLSKIFVVGYVVLFLPLISVSLLNLVQLDIYLLFLVKEHYIFMEGNFVPFQLHHMFLQVQFKLSAFQDVLTFVNLHDISSGV